MLKARFNTEGLSIRLGMLFSHMGISPNAWTIVSLVPAVFGFVALAVYQDLLASLILFLLAGFLDAVDGAVARVTSRVSSLGAFLDGVIDRYVEILLYLGLLAYLLEAEEQVLINNSIWVALLIFGAMMPSFVTAYADHRKLVTDQKDLRRMGGLIERAERLGLVYVAMACGLFISTKYLIIILAVTAVLTNVTAVQRIIYAVNNKR